MTTCQIRIYLLINCWISFFTLAAQNYSVQAELIGTDAGLSGVTTYSIEEDQGGFVWISTINGLDRYDGNEFQFHARNEYHYDDEIIVYLTKNTDNELWLLSSNFSSSYFNQIDKVSIFNRQTKKAIPKSKIDSIQKFFDANDYMYIKYGPNITQTFFTNQLGELWTYQSGSFLQLPIKCFSTIKKIAKHNNGYRLATLNEIFTFDGDWTLLNRVQLPGPFFNLGINEQGTTWVCTKNVETEYEYQMWVLDEALTYQPYSFKDELGNPIKLEFDIDEGYYIYRSKEGFWVVNLKKNIFVFDPEGNQIGDIRNALDFNDPIRFNDLVETKDFLLVSTDMGIIKLKISTEKFKTVYTKSKLSDSRGITEMDDGTLLFSEDKLYSITGEGHQIKSIYSKTTGFGMYYADSLLIVGNGYNVNHSLFTKHLETNQIDYYPPFDSDMVNCIAPTSNASRFWIGSGNGLGLIDLNQKDTINFKKFNGFTELKSSKVKFIYQNECGNWLATNKGVFLVDENEGVLKHFDQVSGDLPFNDINHIYEDQSGVFWLSTNGGGMIKWQFNSTCQPASFQPFNASSGLSSNIVYSIYEDIKNRLWLSSNYGIMCFDKVNQQVKVFLENDGLPHSEFNLTSHYQSQDSTLYFGGLGGLVAFQPNTLDVSFETQTPLALISYETLTNQELQPQDLTQPVVRNTRNQAY